MPAGERKLHLQSSDNARFEVDLRMMKESKLVIDVIEGIEDCTTIFLPTVPRNILIKVIEYSTYHEQSRQSTDQNSALNKDEIEQWDDAFVQVDHPTLVGLINAANYMKMEPLLHLMCGRAAYLVRGKSVEEIRRTFGIVNTLTPEQEAENMKWNVWAASTSI